LKSGTKRRINRAIPLKEANIEEARRRAGKNFFISN